MSIDSFKTRRSLAVGGESFEYFSLPALEQSGFPGVARLPFSLKILLENLIRREDNAFVRADDIRALAHPVLRHRILLNFRAESEGVTTDTLIDELVKHVPLPKSGM